ncbi:MAG: hypothetical protein GQ563_01970, partial [Desulfuromusa sp.]|nr:hypothetical protein [Desulfuromusa sp.]
MGQSGSSNFSKSLILKILIYIIILFATVPLIGCSDLGYYFQCAKGHMKVISNTRPITEVLKDPQTEPAIRQKLKKVLLMRAFAVTELGLPDNDSYRCYADIGRPYAVGYLVAAAEFSLEPKQ